jgi:phage terminase Nu1 subunit (DNA packaging protein)
MASLNSQSPVFVGLLTESQFAEDAGKSLRTIRAWRALGLPVLKRGRLRLIDPAAARAWLEAGALGGCAKPRRRARNRAA